MASVATVVTRGYAIGSASLVVTRGYGIDPIKQAWRPTSTETTDQYRQSTETADQYRFSTETADYLPSSYDSQV